MVTRLPLASLLILGFMGASPGQSAQESKEDSLANLKKAGKLIVAMDATYPPMESEDLDGKISGFDVDFANELASRLGVKTKFMVMGWEGIIGGLVAKRFDLIISAMNVTNERQKQIDFVEYARMSQMLVAKKGTPVAGEKDLAGRMVAVPTDTTSFDFVSKAKKGGLAIKEIKAYRLTSEVFMAVKAGHADVLVVDEPVARFYVKQDRATFVLGGRAMAPEPIGVGIRKGAKTLKDAVQAQVDAMRKDGTMKKLQIKWFGDELGA